MANYNINKVKYSVIHIFREEIGPEVTFNLLQTFRLPIIDNLLNIVSLFSSENVGCSDY